MSCIHSNNVQIYKFDTDHAILVAIMANILYVQLHFNNMVDIFYYCALCTIFLDCSGLDLLGHNLIFVYYYRTKNITFNQ